MGGLGSLIHQVLIGGPPCAGLLFWKTKHANISHLGASILAGEHKVSSDTYTQANTYLVIDFHVRVHVYMSACVCV